MSIAEEHMQDHNPVGIALQNYIDELEQENRLLRSRNDRLEAEAKAVSVQECNPFNGVVQCHNCGQSYTTSHAAQQQCAAIRARV